LLFGAGGYVGEGVDGALGDCVEFGGFFEGVGGYSGLEVGLPQCVIVVVVVVASGGGGGGGGFGGGVE